MKNLIMQRGRILTGLKRWGIDVVALGMILIMGIAAYGKWFYPVEMLLWWERGVAIFELFFMVLLWRFRARFLMWLIAGLIFASWGGYASFWYLLKLPCSCMGSLLHIPTLYTMALDVVFVCVSLVCARTRGASVKSMMIAIILLMGTGVAGFFIGDQIYVGWVAAGDS